jgi:hypothetical protein
MAPIKNTSRGFIGSFISKVGSTQSLAGVAATSTGSSFTPGNGYVYHIFISPGSFYVSNIGYVDSCVIAGGGGGGTAPFNTGEGGGGGAGGMLQTYGTLFPSGTYTISVGAGGQGRVSFGNGGTNGSPSSISGPPLFVTLTATGGGLGGNPSGGSNGGSGGGGGGAGPVGSAGGIGTSFQGNPGGRGQPQNDYTGGGGGGAGLSGFPARGPGVGGAGGDGLAAFNGDTGIPPAYGTSNPTPLPGRWFAGGGTGGSNGPGVLSGGIGGGGTGGNPIVSGLPGTTNTGGGGGGSGSNPVSGGNGGPGIVILRYKVNPN